MTPTVMPGCNAQTDWKGKRRSNDTHASTTDPDARPFRKSHNTAAIMAFHGHVLMENRSGLVVGALVTHVDGMDERAAALAMLDSVAGRYPKTIAADKAYDTSDFIQARRQRRVTLHVARGWVAGGRIPRPGGMATVTMSPCKDARSSPCWRAVPPGACLAPRELRRRCLMQRQCPAAWLSSTSAPGPRVRRPPSAGAR
jgi:hypothetical protein